jgi:ABC-type multidrug transport system fused ATPase/permease subunit
LKWLRRQMRWSTRKNFLFDTTIQENIEYDLAGTALKTESS